MKTCWRCHNSPTSVDKANRIGSSKGLPENIKNDKNNYDNKK